jgi:hypothetical protein
VEVGEEVDEVEVGVEAFEGGAKGVLGVVVGGEEEGGGGIVQWGLFIVHWGGRGRAQGLQSLGLGLGRVGHGAGGGEAGGEVEGEGGFSGAGVSDEEGDFAAGDAVVPEPFEGFGGEGGEAAEGEGVGVGRVLSEHVGAPLFGLFIGHCSLFIGWTAPVCTPNIIRTNFGGCKGNFGNLGRDVASQFESRTRKARVATWQACLGSSPRNGKLFRLGFLTKSGCGLGSLHPQRIWFFGVGAVVI